MKRVFGITSLIIIVALLLSFTQAMAQTVEKPQKTPGAKATEKAVEKGSPKDNAEKGKPMNIQGEVTAVAAGGLTVLGKSGATFQVVVNEKTLIKIPTMGKTGLLTDFKIGDRVVVQARQGTDQIITARMIHLIPSQPTKEHRFGTVTAYTASASITIQGAGGTLTTYKITPATKILPKKQAETLAVGMKVTIVAQKAIGSLELTAKGIVVHVAGEETEGETPEGETPPSGG